MLTRRTLCAGACALAISTAFPAPQPLSADERRLMAMVPRHVTAAQRAGLLAALRDPNPAMRFCMRRLIEMTPAQLRLLVTWLDHERAREEAV